MTNADEIKFWKRANEILSKDIHPKHGIEEMDVDCPECKAAIMIAFINNRLDILEL